MKNQDNLSLLTDLYQLTMGYAYWNNGKHEQESVFNLYFRRNPFKGSYAIAAGLETAIEFLQNFHFDDSDIEYLASLTGNDGKPLFSENYLAYLKTLKFTGDIYAVEEGDVVFPNVPLLQVRAPLIQAQILETPLLTIMNFQTLIATKSNRVRMAAGSDKVLEFGLRRAQGIDGGLSASRAAYIGGADGTSNVLAGKKFGIPVKGTHAHAWVMSFATELEAFEAYAQTMANNCTFLVDTYDTINGVKNAISVGKKLREKGFQLAGIRLDSGDMAALSIEARKLLDESGFTEANIVASNDLDENIITEMKSKGAKVDVWAVGTNLVTAKDQPALGGVYKLSAIKENAEWKYRMKLSEQIIKISNPGMLNVYRYFDENGKAIADTIYDELVPHSFQYLHQDDETNKQVFPENAKKEKLLKPIFQGGKLVAKLKNIEEIKSFSESRKAMFDKSLFLLQNPSTYFIGLEKNLYDIKANLKSTLDKSH